MAAQKPTVRDHTLGVTLSVMVAAVWVGSSELIQLIFGEGSGGYHHPYFLTYFSTSLFSVLLLGFCRKSWRATLGSSPAHPDVAYCPVDTDAPDPGSPLSEEDSSTACTAPTDALPKYTVRDVAVISAKIAPLFFIGNWSFNAGLEMTTVSSSSTIATLANIFTLIIGSVSGTEEFAVVKLIAALATIAGTAIIGRIDGRKGSESLLGDALSVFAALVFAAYTTLLKHVVPDKSKVDIVMMFSFIGLFIFLTAWPGLLVLHGLKWESFEVPGWRVAGLLLLNASIGSVLSDLLWAKSVVLTSPLLGTIGLSLTVPLSIAVDSITGKLEITPSYLGGAALVILGFLLVNIDLAKKDENTAEINKEGTETEST